MKLDVMSQVKTALSSLVSRSDHSGASSKAGATGSLAGATVRMADTATQPAHSGGIGEKMKDFFIGLGTGIANLAISSFETLKGLMTRAPEAQAPAGRADGNQPGGSAATTAKPSPNADPQVVQLKKTLAYQTFHNAVDAKTLSSEQRGACAYAFVKEQASRASGGATAEKVTGAVNTFLRTDNSASKVSARIALDSSQTKAITADILRIIGTNVVGIGASAYGTAGISKENSALGQEVKATAPKHPGIAALLEGGAQSTDAIARETIRVLDDVLCAFIGNPDDLHSIQDAANRIDQNLCDQLAVLKKAVEDSGIEDDNAAGDMILQCGRDTLALRSQCPSIATASTDKDMPAEKKKSIQEINRGVLSIINGKGIGGKDTQPEVEAAGAHMKDRWNPAVSAFISMAAARGNPSFVADAAAKGAALSAEYQSVANTINERIAELSA